MKTWPIALLNHLAGNLTTIAHCWKVTRRDGAVYGFTNWQRDLTIAGVVYAHQSGFTASEIQTTAALNVDDLEMEGFLDSAGITNEDILAGLWDFAELEVFVLNYKESPLVSIGQCRRGNLGEVKRSRSIFVAELRGLMQRLQQRVGRECTAGCPWVLGSPQCGINLNTFTNGKVTTTVTSVTNQRQFAATGLTQAATWFDDGSVLFTGGLNTGVLREVKAHTTGGNIVLHMTFPYGIAPGDSFVATVGCLKRRDEDCDTKFDNLVNAVSGGFGGFTDVPGRNRIMAGT